VTAPVSRILFWVGLAALTILAFVLLQGILMPFLASFVTAYLLVPLVDRLQGWGLPRSLAALAVLLLFLLGVAMVLLLIVPLVQGQVVRLLDRLPGLADAETQAAVRVRTFRAPALERLQHATAAALVAQRFGVAGLRWVVADESAPLARRYFAFLAVAERHPASGWPLFARYLTTDAHHAFVGVATEAARFYPHAPAARRLVELFDAVRGDLHLRAFLSPRILQSLYVLADPATLPFFRALLVAGFTDADPLHCEVTRAVVMVRRFTGRMEPNTKYSDLKAAGVGEALAAAERAFERRRGALHPVAVI